MAYYKCFDSGNGSCGFYPGIFWKECIGYHYCECPNFVDNDGNPIKNQPKPITPPQKWLLYEIVLQHSESEYGINEAIREWDIVNDSEQTECSDCICGHKNIKYTYTIKNRINDNILYPLGSSCIRKFEYQDLIDQLSIVTNKNKIFKNPGKKHDGKTYDEICKIDPQYIGFLSTYAHKKQYMGLIDYYNYYKIKIVS
jgi:hypothetical protein